MDTKTRQQIIVDNLNLVYVALKQLGLYYPEAIEEYYDVGVIGIIKGVNTYEPERGFALSTYLVKCAFNEIGEELRKNNTVKRGSRHTTISLDTIITDDENGVGTLADFIPSQANVEKDAVESVLMERVFEVLRTLPSDDAFILCSYYGVSNFEKLTQAEIAEKLDCSQAQVSRKLRIILDKIKERVNK